MRTMKQELHQHMTMGKILECRNTVAAAGFLGAESSEPLFPVQSYEINLKFSCQVVLRQRVMNIHNASRFLHEVFQPERVHQTRRLLHQLSDLDQPRHRIFLKNRILHWLGVSEGEADQLSTDVIQSALQVTRSALPSHKVFTLGFKLSSVHHHVLEPATLEDGERLSEQRVERIMAAAGNCPKMVPATEESIKNLKRKRVEDDCDDGCVICLDKLEEGYEGVSMPCSHLFHGECIQKWLKTSHYCPICRFKMPTV